MLCHSGDSLQRGKDLHGQCRGVHNRIRCIAFFVLGLRQVNIGNPMTTQTITTVNTQQAAELLGLSPNTLNQWRHIKRGPAFHKFGKSVRYSLQELEAYMEQTRRERTSRFGDQSY
jgi:excisionase family DNA binding protein